MINKPFDHISRVQSDNLSTTLAGYNPMPLSSPVSILRFVIRLSVFSNHLFHWALEAYQYSLAMSETGKKYYSRGNTTLSLWCFKYFEELMMLTINIEQLRIMTHNSSLNWHTEHGKHFRKEDIHYCVIHLINVCRNNFLYLCKYIISFDRQIPTYGSHQYN